MIPQNSLKSHKKEGFEQEHSGRIAYERVEQDASKLGKNIVEGAHPKSSGS